MNGTFALTFDDGPGPDTLELMLCLDSYGVKATFFVLGENVDGTDAGTGEETGAGLVVRLLQNGHSIGNHTYSHQTSAAAAASMSSFIDEIARTDALINRLRLRAGLAASTQLPFRLPYGPLHIALPTVGASRYRKDPRLAALARLRRPHVHWTGVFDDWEPLAGGADELAQRLIRHVSVQCEKRELAVLLLHDGAPRSEIHPFRARRQVVQAMPSFLEEARRNGWRHVLL